MNFPYDILTCCKLNQYNKCLIYQQIFKKDKNRWFWIIDISKKFKYIVTFNYEELLLRKIAYVSLTCNTITELFIHFDLTKYSKLRVYLNPITAKTWKCNQHMPKLLAVQQKKSIPIPTMIWILNELSRLRIIL